MASGPRLLRDPLIHFLLAGALLFLLYGAVNGGSGDAPDRITVSESRVRSLAETFERTWMRPPTKEELRGLVEDFVTEEILYREALALGLDRDDLVVRRRMRQKMEFLTEEAAGAEPTAEELAAFLREHPDRFALPTRVSFEQIFLDPERAEIPPEARAEAVLGALRGREAPDPASLGDPTLLPTTLEGATAREVSDTFGAAFAEALEDAPEGAWTGPLVSSFGHHLVRVGARLAARVPELDEVRASVERELAARRRDEVRERFHRELREGYEIELPATLALSMSDDGR